ncbi:MAG: hypothetical protein IKE61_05185, partial [Coriobacteriales bacterium]|nr:hypothetical protein [Coriobacteriales bacterium]
YFAKKTSYLKVRARNLRVFPHELKVVLGLGLSPFLIQLAAALQQFIQNMMLTSYGGDAAISALSICGSLSTLLLFPMVGFTQGGSPIMGYNYGAGNYERIKGTLFRAMAFGTIFAIISWAAIMLWPEAMVGLFISNDPEVAALSAHALQVFLFGLPFIPVGMCGGALFQSTGKIFRSMFLSLIRQFIYYIPLMLVLPIWFGLDGCWLAAPASDVAAFIISIIVVYMGLKSIKREMETIGVGKLVA